MTISPIGPSGAAVRARSSRIRVVVGRGSRGRHERGELRLVAAYATRALDDVLALHRGII
jgi:hypothetical protein